MARRKKVPLFEVMQQTRLKEQQRAAQEDLQAQRERLRAIRRAEDEAKAAAKLEAEGPPKPSRISSLLGSLGLAPRQAHAAEPVSVPDRDDPTAGRSANSLYRRVNAPPRPEPTPEPSPAPAPTPVPRDIEPIAPKPSPLADLKRNAAEWAAKSNASARATAKKIAAAVKPADNGDGINLRLGPVPIAVGAVCLLTLITIGYFAIAGGDDAIAQVEDPQALPLDPSVIDIGDDDANVPDEPLTAARGIDNAPPRIIEPEPVTTRETGKIYVAVMSYAAEDKAKADLAAADLRRAGISVTVEYDLAAYPDRYTVVGTRAFDKPGVGDWEPYVNNIKDVSENRRRTGRHDAFRAAPLFWANR